MLALPSISFLDSFYLPSLSLSMASFSTVHSVSKMVELRANGLRIPILFPVDANGFAWVSSHHLSIRFSLQNSII